jgi:DNA polymerase I-like protein with 3'-5' exonuclease and polymerase domains
MDIITIDFETFYDQDYSLKKMTTEEYIRDPRFEVIGVAVKRNNEGTQWASGTHEQIKEWLQTEFNWAESMVLAHNTMFDGAILHWKFGINPRYFLDTLCMGRALHGVEVGGSLKAMADRYGVGQKGTEVNDAKGKRRTDFSDTELSRYGDYCINDVELTYKLFTMMVKTFPKKELQLIDLTLRMFIEPVLDLDLPLLEAHLSDVQDRKQKLLEDAGATREVLMSNPKFAELLRSFGVEPPMKESPTTGKQTLALAKNDEGFKALQNHEDVRVQTLVAARLGTKSTLEETRTQRFIDISKRGKLPVPVRYYAAHTGRWGGDDKINLQNLPSRGANANKLKQAIIAPPGHYIIDADSAQIEARVLAWLAGQEDLVKSFANKEDVYKKMASAIYNKPESEITKEERFVGKTTILGCISEGTLVLSDSGWKPIENISKSDKVWDGEEFVCHRGLLDKGIKQTLSLCGAWLTPDHKVWSGTQWLEAQSVVADESILYQALAIGAVNLPSQAIYGVRDLGLKPLSSNASVTKPNTPWTTITSKISKVLDALFARSKQAKKRDIGNTPRHYRTTPIAPDYLTGCLRLSPVATTQTQSTMYITGQGGSRYMMGGATIGQRFLGMHKHLLGGITQSLKWIESITTKGTNPEICGLFPAPTICETDVVSENYSRRLRTYDIAYAGPRNRFTILTKMGPVIVHNCGYGMGAVKFQAQLKTFGYDMNIDEARRVIQIYREKNDQIVNLWKQSQNVLVNMLSNVAAPLGRSGVLEVIPAQRAIKLPSGLLMRYDDLDFEQGEQGLEFNYKTRKGRTRIYGGKVVENVCQGIARCIIGEQMFKIAKKYKVVLTVHDAIACVVPKEQVEEAVVYVEQCMRWVPEWADGLPLNCESGYGESYGDC